MDRNVFRYLKDGDSRHPQDSAKMDWDDFRDPANGFIKAFIFTPRMRIHKGEEPTPPGQLHYPRQVNALIHKVKQILPALRPTVAEIIDYAPWQMSLEGVELAPDNPRGKFIIRYDPIFVEKSCQGPRMSGFELWAEAAYPKAWAAQWVAANQPHNKRGGVQHLSDYCHHQVCPHVVDSLPVGELQCFRKRSPPICSKTLSYFHGKAALPMLCLSKNIQATNYDR
ncbi:hypothetical protein FKW77_010900 [Venturia effusa]|uniref:Uncharacterized protein n=1 Tax=Venturia effusa TaxID=50376 RepID=A0A517KYS3_9PEZI|nr:hypothetical protein FKW77_010900 [Venturia effusa]